MKRKSLVALVCLSVLASSVGAFAQTNLTVVRRANNSVWAQRCNGVDPASCDAWKELYGRFSSQPTLTWDASIRKYIMVGVGMDGRTWKGTFTEDGTFDGTWREVGSAAAVSPLAMAAASPLTRRVVTVDVNGGGNFTSPVAALASITTASASDPYLVRILPGVYDVGATPVQMKEFVDIEGSGELVTIITGAVDGAGNTAAVVQGSDNAQLRFLTVQNTFSAGVANLAIGNFGVSPTLVHVRALATGDGASTRNLGVFNSGGTPSLSHVTVNVSGGRYTYGIFNTSGTAAVIEDVTIEASGAVYNNGVRNYSGSDVQMQRVTIHVDATGVGAPESESFGVLNSFSSPRMSDVTVTAKGGQNPTASNVGVDNVSASPVLMNVSMAASGGPDDFGMLNEDDSSPVLTNVVAYGSTAGLKSMTNGSTSSVTIDRSTITGDLNAILNDSGTSLMIGGSKLGGARNTLLGTWTCVGSYNEAYSALGADCN